MVGYKPPSDYTSFALYNLLRGRLDKTLHIYGKFILRMCGNYGPHLRQVISDTYLVQKFNSESNLMC